MKKFRISSTFFAMLAVALIAVGCNENEDPITPTDRPNNASNFQATSGGSTSIMLRWTAPTTTAAVSLEEYELTWTPGGTTPVSIPANQTSYTVTGLTEGTPYVFTLKSKGDNDEMSSGVQVTWAPARISAVYQLYSHLSSQGSGLDLYNAQGTPEVLTVADGQDWDLAFDTRGGYFIGSPAQTDYVVEVDPPVYVQFPNGDPVRKTYVEDTKYTPVSSLTSIFESAALTVDPVERLHNIDPDADNGFAFVVRTAEGNFAKVLVMSKNGRIVQGSGNNEFIEVQVSYQTVANVPYAMPKPSDNAVKGESVQRREARPLSAK